ncbi:hypothetical protein [Fulvivirga lutea]|uniref:Lipoprotein n=1 Tax=Fulvivirga lutea TaxID=2810512 RepID=A0A974WFF6_9BACT|nr:hypothetical protein [Fulvivirga lutea]QSE97231.1 hypothetical protein JR347_16815 [Fulvivirga lutea]
MNTYKIIFAIFISTLFIISCSKRDERNYSNAEDYCLNIKANIDSVIHERDTLQDSLLLEIVKKCGNSPKFVELRLSILSKLNRYNEGLEYIKSLDDSNFLNPYDSLVYSVSFQQKLIQDEFAKLDLTQKVVHEMENHLAEFPLDTLALANYCQFSLEYKSKDEVLDKIDSMARNNNFDRTYDFVVWLYFPDKQKLFHQRKLDWENQKSI